MLLSGKLNAHLVEIDRQATEMFERLTRQMAAEQESREPDAWVVAMNNIRNVVEEVILFNLIYL